VFPVPSRPEGVYQDSRGGWYFKVTVGRDPLTGRREQVTRRGFATATAAGRARRDVLAKCDSGQLRPAPKLLTVDELLDLYLDGLDADGSLGAKTRFDYRHYAAKYVRPWLGARKVRDVTPEVILTWQRKLLKEGGTKNGKALAPNTIRLARAPLAGAFNLAVSTGIVASSPLSSAPRPKARRSIPRHWTPERAREFLALMEGDRTWPVWAFLLGSGLRIGELVWLRWSNVDLRAGLVRVVEFTTALGYDLVASEGKSRDSVRTIDLDPGLVRVLKQQKKLQTAERLAASSYEETDYVFTKPEGGCYHPQNLSRMLGK
jgi:integrase